METDDILVHNGVVGINGNGLLDRVERKQQLPSSDVDLKGKQVRVDQVGHLRLQWLQKLDGLAQWIGRLFYVAEKKLVSCLSK